MIQAGFCGSAGLDLASFELDDLAKEVIPKVNELLYDTLAYIVKSDSADEHFLLGTDSLSDRDGRRALLDLIKGCVPPGVRQTLQEEHSQLRYPARVDPRPLLAKEQRLVRAMEEKVGKHLSHVSLLDNGDVREHPAPVSAPSANAVTSDVPRLHAAHYNVPTEEFPGGTELVPVRHYVPSMTIGPLISAVTCSFEPATESFVEPADALEHYSIDEFLAGSETDELDESESGQSFVETLYGQSANRPQQASVVLRAAACPLRRRSQQLCPRRTIGGQKGIMLLATTLTGGHGTLGLRALLLLCLMLDRLRHLRRLHRTRHRLRRTVSPGHELEEVEQPALNGNHGSARGGLYIDDSYGMDLTAPLQRAGSSNIADILTQPHHCYVSDRAVHLIRKDSQKPKNFFKPLATPLVKDVKTLAKWFKENAIEHKNMVDPLAVSDNLISQFVKEIKPTNALKGNRYLVKRW
ncbi:hypothetical protein CYMTET_18612 [Cymbomonas tetramitiformis]|uniref:Uncharacterized protein n=1 Tax=Cymbomonas tetramitiformis TaxID=36881 RepID=A0AAE0G838_9CHLO|nr:hypothetical protein CYMTET_18612 [Cymbomonas tetramitiformis]